MNTNNSKLSTDQLFELLTEEEKKACEPFWSAAIKVVRKRKRVSKGMLQLECRMGSTRADRLLEIIKRLEVI